MIGFIGAGKVGVSLGKYFSSKNQKLIGYYSRNFSAAQQAAEFTNSKAFHNIEDLLDECKIIFLTTTDDSLISVWNDISKYNLKGKIICHTSGTLSSDIFNNIDNLGAFGYSIHPLYAFSDKYNSYKNLHSAYFSIEGSETYLVYVKTLLESLGNKVLVISKDKKPLYHLASVTVSNLVLSLINLGCGYLESCGINQEDALSSLMPLIENNIKNLNKDGFIPALTGPVERGDINTIISHLDVIPTPHKELYKILSLNLLSLSMKKHSSKDYVSMQACLEKTEYKEVK
jgi:predicted short-subunit dehydrogenase-like oxidoreductase (DUF2520 family)